MYTPAVAFVARPARVVSLAVGTVRAETTEAALDAAVASAFRVATAAAPWAVIDLAGVSTVNEEGRESHSADVWKDPRWRLQCNSWNLGGGGQSPPPAAWSSWKY